MKNIKKKIQFIAAAAVMGAAVSGCSLDMLPLNDVVLENYWTDKKDVESVMTSCYAALQEKGYVSQLIVWGETRSDNLIPGPNVSASLSSLMKGSLKTTNTYCNWEAMYNVINRCNTVLYYAPQVAEKDPNYTTDDLNINIAECKALRAMSYLTLIKTFQNVPFSLEPSIDDNQEYRIPQTSFENILDALIQDMESCKNYAPYRYTDDSYNTAKITRPAVYALLAELYLWRASDKKLDAESQNNYYRKCIEYCDKVIDYKTEQMRANNIPNVDLDKIIDKDVWNEYGYPLLAEIKVGEGAGSSLENAFYYNFGRGRSFETLFEITYYDGSHIKTNGDVQIYGVKNGNSITRQVLTNDKLMTSVPKGTSYDNTTLFPMPTDVRSIKSFRYSENGGFEIQKYICKNVEISYNGTGNISYVNLTKNDPDEAGLMYPNWIVYRLSEVMLFKAEAEIELAGNTTKDASAASAVQGLYDDAHKLICAVYHRSNPVAKTKPEVLPVRANLKTLSEFEALLMNERQREFLFEGKRYYDLVRQSRREGNTQKFVSKLSTKFGEGGASVGIKMKQMDFMYMPILKSQMIANPNLVQNSAYLDEEQIVNN